MSTRRYADKSAGPGQKDGRAAERNVAPPKLVATNGIATMRDASAGEN
jgi:hypothetical protein